MLIAPVPALVNVTLCAALVVFTRTLPKFNGPPVNFMALPKPVMATELTALKKPLELIVILPRRLPELVGAKYTYIEQVLPLVRLAGQLSASLKLPLVAML